MNGGYCRLCKKDCDKTKKHQCACGHYPTNHLLEMTKEDMDKAAAKRAINNAQTQEDEEDMARRQARIMTERRSDCYCM